MTTTKTKPKPKAAKPAKKTAKAAKKRGGLSRREQQRLIAVKLGGANRGVIQADELREACRKAGLLEGNGAANFTQDMKKDAALFAVSKTRKRGSQDAVVAWKLTDAGKTAAKQAAKAAN